MMQGKRTYTAIATVLVGLALKKASAHLPDDLAQSVAPDLIDVVGDLLATGGSVAAAYFRKLATRAPTADEQDTVTPRP